MFDSTPVVLSRKERERLARREEILDAARTVFSNRGFEKARLDEIAEVAELGKGTIYNYFKSKEELFVSVIVRGMRRFQEFVQEALQQAATPADKLSAFVDAAFEFFERHRQLFSIFELERSHLARSLDDDMMRTFCDKEADVMQLLEQIFFEGVRRGDFQPLDPGRLARTLFGVIHVATIHAVRDPEKMDLKEEARFIKQVMFHGIMTEPKK